MKYHCYNLFIFHFIWIILNYWNVIEILDRGLIQRNYAYPSNYFKNFDLQESKLFVGVLVLPDCVHVCLLLLLRKKQSLYAIQEIKMIRHSKTNPGKNYGNKLALSNWIEYGFVFERHLLKIHVKHMWWYFKVKQFTYVCFKSFQMSLLTFCFTVIR